jgi:hypothetical protein
VVALIKLDEVEEIIRQVLKPTVPGALKLLDVCDYNIGFLKVRLFVVVPRISTGSG